MSESKLSPKVQSVMKDVQAGKFASIADAIKAVQAAGGEISLSAENRDAIAAMKKAGRSDALVSVERQAAPFSLKETKDGKISIVNRWFCATEIESESFSIIINFGQNEPTAQSTAFVKIESFEGTDKDGNKTDVEFLKFIKFA